MKTLVKSLAAATAIITASTGAFAQNIVNVDKAGTIIFGFRHISFTVKGTTGTGTCATEGTQINTSESFLETLNFTSEEANEILDSYLATLTTAQITGKQVEVALSDNTNCNQIVALRLLD